MTPIFLPYQRRWIENTAKFSIYVKSRRIGISFAEAFWSVQRRLKEKVDHWFVSATKNTAIEFIRYCKLWAEVLNVVCESKLIDLSDATTETLTFPNGSRITALSRNPEALRGMGGDVTLDEFGFSEWASELLTAAQPVITWGGQLRIISTQNGRDTVFYQLAEKAAKGEGRYKLFKTTLVDAVADGLAAKVPGDHQKLPPKERDAEFVAQMKESAWSEEAFQQEFMCETATYATIINPEEYDRCILPGFVIPNELDAKKKYGPLYIGGDIGRSKNLTVIWALEEGVDPKAPPNRRLCYRTVAVKELDGMPFAAQSQVFDRFISHPAVMRACVDAGGIGMQIAEDLYSTYGERVQKVHIAQNTKARIVERAKKYIAQERVSLPDNAETKADILAMRRIVTRSGGYSYDGASGHSHCDRYIALALALEAAETPRFELLSGAGQNAESEQGQAGAIQQAAA